MTVTVVQTLKGTGKHRRPTLAERVWAQDAFRMGLVLATAVASGLITGAFLAIVQAVN